MPSPPATVADSKRSQFLRMILHKRHMHDRRLIDHYLLTTTLDSLLSNKGLCKIREPRHQQNGLLSRQP